MKAFEIHTFQGGKWKIDSVFDDRDLAMFEAQRIDESARYSGVRVIEETFDETTQKSTTRTIFRGRVEQANAKRAKEAAARRETPQTKPKKAAAPPPRRPRKQRRPEKKKASPARLAIAFGVIVMLGFVAMVVLRYISAAVAG